ncbi:MAG: hypothetical protein ACKVQU_03175 [Burkholderiales bacterium]
MGEHGFEHFHDGALLGFRKSGEALHLLLQTWGRPALAISARRTLADQFLDRCAQRLRERGQHGSGDAQPPDLVMGERLLRDPEAPARRSTAALAKVTRHTLDDGTPPHSFSTLLAELTTIVRNTCRTPMAKPDAPTFEVTTTPNPKQLRALELIEKIRL